MGQRARTGRKYAVTADYPCVFFAAHLPFTYAGSAWPSRVNFGKPSRLPENFTSPWRVSVCTLKMFKFYPREGPDCWFENLICTFREINRNRELPHRSDRVWSILTIFSTLRAVRKIKIFDFSVGLRGVIYRVRCPKSLNKVPGPDLSVSLIWDYRKISKHL